jgi:hypothetical protein
MFIYIYNVYLYIYICVCSPEIDSEQHQKRHIRAIDGLHGAIHRQPMGAALDSAALPELVKLVLGCSSLSY